MIRILFIISILSSNAIAQKTSPQKTVTNNQRIINFLDNTTNDTLKSDELRFLAHYHDGQLPLAMEVYKKLDKKILHKSTQLLYADILLRSRNYPEAFKLAVSIQDPKNPDIRIDFVKARCLIHLRKIKKGQELLDMVLQIRPDHAGAHYYYSLIHLSAKNWLEARKSAQAALRESQFGEPWASKASLIIAGCHARITADARKPQDKKAE